MTEPLPARADAPRDAAAPPLSDAEIRANLYFSIGVGSEGSIAGRDVSNKLQFAGNIDADTRIMRPVANSGYSIGTLQTDLGQHPEIATSLVDAYQTWSRANAAAHPGWTLDDAQAAQLTRDLSRTGHQIEGRDTQSLADNGRDIDAVTKTRLGTFLQSDEGITFIHARDVAQVEHLTRETTGPRRTALESIEATALYRNASTDDQLRLSTIVAKLENQSGRAYYPGIVNRIDHGELDNVADVTRAVGALLPNDARGRPDYIESGATHALAATEVLIGLRNASPDSPLHAAWQSVVADPLANPTTLTGSAASQYDTVKSLFLQPEQGTAFIRALDAGDTHAWPPANRPLAGNAGYFSSGDDFVMWNRDGRGHACIDGRWSDLDRQDVTRTVNRDGTTDLDITENGATRRLLHIDPHAPNFRNTRSGSDTTEELRDAAPPARLPGAGPAHPQGRPHEDERAPDQQQGRRQPAGLLLDDAAHPGHAMYASLLGVVHERDRTLGREPDDFSRQLAGGLTAEARERGLQQIGFAAFTPDGRTVAMTDTPDPTAPWARTAVGAAADLAGQPLAQSSEQVSRLAQQQAVEQTMQAPSQQQGIEAVQRGPRLV